MRHVPRNFWIAMSRLCSRWSYVLMLSLQGLWCKGNFSHARSSCKFTAAKPSNKERATICEPRQHKLRSKKVFCFKSEKDLKTISICIWLNKKDEPTTCKPLPRVFIALRFAGFGFSCRRCSRHELLFRNGNFFHQNGVSLKIQETAWNTYAMFSGFSTPIPIKSSSVQRLSYPRFTQTDQKNQGRTPYSFP